MVYAFRPTVRVGSLQPVRLDDITSRMTVGKPGLESSIARTPGAKVLIRGGQEGYGGPYEVFGGSLDPVVCYWARRIPACRTRHRLPNEARHEEHFRGEPLEQQEQVNEGLPSWSYRVRGSR